MNAVCSETLDYVCLCVCVAAAESQQIVQKKTFTKWINSRLSADSGRPSITDLFDDLRDGTHLLLLLETLAGIKLVSRQQTFPFSALTLLVGRQEEHPACKNWVLVCWC